MDIDCTRHGGSCLAALTRKHFFFGGGVDIHVFL